MITYRGFSIDVINDEDGFRAEAFNKAGEIKIGFGSTKDEALDNIRDIISEDLDTIDLD